MNQKDSMIDIITFIDPLSQPLSCEKISLQTAILRIGFQYPIIVYVIIKILNLFIILYKYTLVSLLSVIYKGAASLTVMAKLL